MMNLGGGKGSDIECSSQLHQVHEALDFSENRAGEQDHWADLQRGPIGQQVPDPARTDPGPRTLALGCENSPSSLGNELLMSLIYLGMGRFQ